jgi:hypothetical protein
MRRPLDHKHMYPSSTGRQGSWPEPRRACGRGWACGVQHIGHVHSQCEGDSIWVMQTTCTTQTCSGSVSLLQQPAAVVVQERVPASLYSYISRLLQGAYAAENQARQCWQIMCSLDCRALRGAGIVGHLFEGFVLCCSCHATRSVISFTIPRWHEVTPVVGNRPRYSVSAALAARVASCVAGSLECPPTQACMHTPIHLRNISSLMLCVHSSLRYADHVWNASFPLTLTVALFHAQRYP